MVDHNAMREAMNRALEEIHNDFCNNCKAEYIEYTGHYNILNTFEKNYLIWYCDNCPSLDV